MSQGSITPRHDIGSDEVQMMNQRHFTPSRLRLRAPVRPPPLALLGVSLCALACGSRYEIGDIAAKRTPQQSDGSSNVVSRTASAAPAVPRTIITDAYDVDATVAEPDSLGINRQVNIVPLGDVDGDGYGDWAEYGATPLVSGIDGGLYQQIVYGAPRPQQGGVIPAARASFESDLSWEDWFATAGDVNGDGYADMFINEEISVGAGSLEDGVNVGETLASQGTAWDAPLGFLVLGGPERALGPLPSGAFAFDDRDGLATHFASELASGAPNTISDATQYIKLHSLGDLDHDGFDDFSVTTTFSFEEDTPSSGKYSPLIALESRSESVSYVVYGSSSLESSRAAAARLAGIRAVYPAGDVNGDGFGDLLLIGANRVYLWPGGAVHPSGDLNPEVDAVPLDDITPAPGILGIIDSMPRLEPTTLSTGSVGDLDHDGYDDFLVDGGSTGDAASSQKAFLYYGRPNIFSRPLAANSVNAVFDLEPNGTVQRAGDWNADGYDDLIIDHEDLSLLDETFIFPALTETRLLPGTPQRWTGTITLPEDQLALITNSDKPRNPPYQVTPAGDLDGDGVADLLLRRCFPASDPSSPYISDCDTAIKYGSPLAPLTTQIR
jgi:hypothetical protein